MSEVYFGKKYMSDIAADIVADHRREKAYRWKCVNCKKKDACITRHEHPELSGCSNFVDDET